MYLLKPSENVYRKMDYLVDQEFLIDDEDYCLICMEMLTEPLECMRCRGVYCTPCTINWKQVNNRCPKKCTTGEWKLKNIPNKVYSMRCPYSNTCKKFDSSEWERHLVYCPSAPESVRRRLELMTSFRCNNGHKLTSSHNRNKKCSDCEEVGRCLSGCEECQLNYCKKCRLPELTKVICSNSHKYIGTKDAFTCDKCFKHFFNQQGYKDEECGLAVCRDCMKDLPRREDEQEILRSLKRGRRYSAGNIFH